MRPGSAAASAPAEETAGTVEVPEVLGSVSPSPGTRVRWLAAAATLALALAVLLGGCSRSTPKLDALKADPMATVAIPGVRIEREYGHAEGEALGKPLIASYSRTFVVTEGEPRDIVRAVKVLAEASGWTTDYEDEDSYRASKTLTPENGEPFGLPANLGFAFKSDHSGGVLRMTQR